MISLLTIYFVLLLLMLNVYFTDNSLLYVRLLLVLSFCVEDG